MAFYSRTYADGSRTTALPATRARLGRPHSRRPTRIDPVWREHDQIGSNLGSHMPIDTDIHWKWRNPLNVIPALLLLLLVSALVGIVV